jgi:hypothetical protein
MINTSNKQGRQLTLVHEMYLKDIKEWNPSVSLYMPIYISLSHSL